MGKSFKERIALEVIIILGILAVFCLILRMWPLVFLVIPGILIAALRMLFVSARKKQEEPVPVPVPPEQPCAETEQDVVRIAFGILQRRITEHVVARYPAARWVWETPNPMERFSSGQKLSIMLNNAGGFAKAEVKVNGLWFCGLSYVSAVPEQPPEPPAELDADGDTGLENDEAVDYALIAFQWVEANLLNLNDACNNAIAEGQTTMPIPMGDLPHPDSWGEICDELTRNGFAGAAVQEGGISVILPK
jgi:hypothetical protein